MGRDLNDPRWMHLKAALLLGVDVPASALLLEHPTWRTAALLAAAVWGFSRAYSFAFYVVERYLDPGCRFAGLASFVRHLCSRRPPVR